MRVSNDEEASLLTERVRFHLITNLEGSQPGTLCFFLIRCYLERAVMSSPEVEEDQPSPAFYIIMSPSDWKEHEDAGVGSHSQLRELPSILRCIHSHDGS